MSGERGRAWRERAEQATGSRRVTAGSVGGGILDDIDAVLAEDDEPETSPEGEERREPYL
ncbi:hypothetical protein GCM10009836_27040 [Pseudonocardia ailaonensis]|uniref:Uncharacterized protein n=1 Tax=Pseudonocardia ailaonensis TaxID=367279 RepID=A0ABN2N0C1_9PSEU